MSLELSVIVPVFNEEKEINNCIDSILKQDYPLEKMEIIFVDGNSSDRTRFIIEDYQKKYPDLILILENFKKIVPISMNIGIKKAKGRYILRLDAHSEYPVDYIKTCIATLERTKADNVGGLALSKGKGRIGEAFAQILSSKFGVGNSSFRTNAKSGYVDTVPFGAFKKTVFKQYGLYDERLERNQDYELNYRIRKNGGKIFLNSEIKLYYLCKNTVAGILKQSFNNGKWNIITSKVCPHSMGIRHYIPFFFFLSLIILPILSIVFSIIKYILLLELVVYCSFDIIFSMQDSDNQHRNHFFIKLFLFPLFHIAYGFGSFCGLFSEIVRKRRS